MKSTMNSLSCRLFAGLLTFGLFVALSGGVFDNAALAGTVKYSAKKFEKIKNSGKAVMLDFYAPWCGTCRTQSRVIKALRANNTAYEKITFMTVDWDTNKSKPIAQGFKIPRRSTLVMFKGGREVGRVVAGTSSKVIKKLLNRGL